MCLCVYIVCVWCACINMWTHGHTQVYVCIYLHYNIITVMKQLSTITQVGPAGSLMGIISTLLVYVILEWKRFINPLYEICKLLVLILFALIIGLLPYVDNFAHIGGLVTGVLLSAIFVPYYPPYEGEEYKIPQSHRDKLDQFRRIKILLVAICLPTFITIYVIIFVLFYEVQPNCSGCTYITCIPFTDTICQDQQPTPENRDRNL